MQMHRQGEIVSAGLVGNMLSRGAAVAAGTGTEERLPFTVKVAHSEQELGRAVQVRHAAYARHLPALAERLKVPESYDHDEGSVVLLAESKMDGSPLGTMRIQTNLYRPLAIEQAVELPEWLKGRSLAEATRLGVSDGRIGRLVKTVLFKAFFEYCLDAQIEWMVIAARAPLDRQYEALLFRDVFPGGGFIPLSYASNIPHRVLAFEVETAERRWAEARHPLFDFMRRTRHPDIDVREAETAYSAVAKPMDWFAGAHA